MSTENKELTQKIWEEELYDWLQKERLTGKTIDLGSALTSKGFSRQIKNIVFSGKKLHNLTFNNLEFHNCKFDEIDFRKNSFSKLIMKKCTLEKTKWLDIVLEDVSFHECDFSFSEIVYSELKHVSITESKLLSSHWSNTELFQINFKNSTLNESVFNSTFIQESSISDSFLNDVFLLRTKGEFLQENCTSCSTARPVIGISWDFLQRGTFSPYIDKALRDNSAIVLKIEMEPRSIDINKLNKEVTECIKSQSETYSSIIARKLFSKLLPESEIDKIKTSARSLLDYCDALVLPGGKDIEAEFYIDGNIASPQCDYRRSVVEFALLEHAHKMKIPVMGTCRGSQMINVYFGGSLRQHVDGQENAWQWLSFANSSKKEELQRWIGQDTLFALSMHHQACDRMGADLEIVIEFEGIPKLFISHDSQFIGVQFHPEVYIIIDRFGEDRQEAGKGKGIYQLFFSNILENCASRM